jgi:hypothetical protein
LDREFGFERELITGQCRNSGGLRVNRCGNLRRSRAIVGLLGLEGLQLRSQQICPFVLLETRDFRLQSSPAIAKILYVGQQLVRLIANLLHFVALDSKFIVSEAQLGEGMPQAAEISSHLIEFLRFFRYP